MITRHAPESTWVEHSNASIDQKEKTMERKILERRSVLKGGVAAVGMLGSGASTAMVASIEQASAHAAQPPLPEQILSALERFRSTIPANFDREYVEKAVTPFFLTSLYEGERPMLPMIDVNFSKENALPYDLWGLITHDWRPTPEAGVTVFLQGLEKRGIVPSENAEAEELRDWKVDHRRFNIRSKREKVSRGSRPAW
jgi:hypothetical protein